MITNDCFSIKFNVELNLPGFIGDNQEEADDYDNGFICTCTSVEKYYAELFRVDHCRLVELIHCIAAPVKKDRLLYREYFLKQISDDVIIDFINIRFYGITYVKDVLFPVFESIMCSEKEYFLNVRQYVDLEIQILDAQEKCEWSISIKTRNGKVTHIYACNYNQPFPKEGLSVEQFESLYSRRGLGIVMSKRGCGKTSLIELFKRYMLEITVKVKMFNFCLSRDVKAIESLIDCKNPESLPNVILIDNIHKRKDLYAKINAFAVNNRICAIGMANAINTAKGSNEPFRVDARKNKEEMPYFIATAYLPQRFDIIEDSRGYLLRNHIRIVFIDKIWCVRCKCNDDRHKAEKYVILQCQLEQTEEPF